MFTTFRAARRMVLIVSRNLRVRQVTEAVAPGVGGAECALGGPTCNGVIPAETDLVDVTGRSMIKSIR